MRFFKKEITPNFFIENTKELQIKLVNLSEKKDKKEVWDKEYKEKKFLKKHILENEQSFLCGYCECKIKIAPPHTKANCHLEHLEPKDNDEDKLTLDYSNIIVSCQGNTTSNCKTESCCGHHKANKYDESLFINPTTMEDIREHFIYDIESGKIESDTENGKYMIKHLNLNDSLNNIPKARKDTLEAFEENLKGRSREEVISILNQENREFISFLRYRYKNILKENN